MNQFGGNFLLFSLGVLGLSLLLAVLYSAKRSTFLAILVHALLNATYGMGFMAAKGDSRAELAQNLIFAALGVVAMTVSVSMERSHAGSAPER